LRSYFHNLVEDGYIFAFQDIRGRFKSGGQFAMMRPARDASDPKAIDEASDTRDTIDWLLGIEGPTAASHVNTTILADCRGDADHTPRLPSPNLMTCLGTPTTTERLNSYGLSTSPDAGDAKETTPSFRSARYLRGISTAASNVNAHHFNGKHDWNDFVAPNQDPSAETTLHPG
jgi:hypothetical protein